MTTRPTLTTIVCPNCKHKVTLETGKKAAVCPFCSGKIVTSERTAEK